MTSAFRCSIRQSLRLRLAVALLVMCGLWSVMSGQIAGGQVVTAQETSTSLPANAEKTASVAIAVDGSRDSIDFERDVQPILTRFGCNAGACHGKARGQNGFQLSLLGFDSQFDFDAITKEGRGRRVFLSSPSDSLMVTKPTARVPHGGGRRLQPGSPEIKLIEQWIRDGAHQSIAGTPELERVTIEPTDVVLKRQATASLTVTAHYDNGETQDITRLASFQSNESPIAAVDEYGKITAGNITGEAAIMARYMGQIAVCRTAVPLPGQVPDSLYEELPTSNFIDGLVWLKLKRLGLTASTGCADHEFLRRATIDIIGRAPTMDEAVAYLQNKSADKRTELVDRLLADPEFADHWANKWVDLLRPNPYRVGLKTVLNYDAWIRDGFRQNKPWDQFVKELLTAKGSTFHNGAVTMFRDRRSPDELTTMVSQLFLGIRLECAKCHHHPFEVWGQDDFYSFAAAFAKVARKGTGLSPPISGSEEFVFAGTKGSVKHPLTDEVMQPRPLFGEFTSTSQDPRVQLAEWITSATNDNFAQVMANRVWADMMGVGLVEPVDDLRATNPPSNGPLLVALADDFRDGGFDLKKLIRRIATSHVYTLSSLPTDRNVTDTRNYSRHYRQRLRAETLLDSFVEITNVQESFSAMPPDSSARQIWTHRVDSLFLDAFGRPDPNQDPPCERTTDTTVVQALHLMNAKNLNRKIEDESGRVAELAKSDKTPGEIAEELYLRVYSRFPTKTETQTAVEYFAKDKIDRREAIEDLLWALVNTPEFVFKN